MFRLGRALAATMLLGVMVMVHSVAAQADPRNTYIVVLKPGAADVAATAAGFARAHGGAVGFTYQHALRGFSIRVPAQAAAAIARSPAVAYVEADREFTVAAQTDPTGVKRIFAPGNANIGIDGADERVDVDVAVIDTGIDLDHPDLNVVGSTNCASGGAFTKSCGAGGDDGNGHGTHVAGSIGAIDDGNGVVGVAPGARLWAVRVLNDQGSGYTSWIVAGMEWVAARKATIEVANMSLGGGTSQALDDAANSMANAGVAVAVAAGNSDANASNSSPARAQRVLTVSALADFNGQPGGGAAPTCRADVDDTLADFSNWGSTIELAAPGVCILSTWLNGGYNTISGTSMASPHAAGGLALLASKGFDRSWTGVSGLYATLTSNGNLNWTDDSGDGIKERLLDVSNTSAFDPVMTGGDPPPDNQPPVASFTSSCNGLTCTFNGSGSSDPDGEISTYAWAFGDGTAASGVTTSRAYASAATYLVTLTVTDNDGATASASRSVPVTSPATGTNVALSGTSVSIGSRWTANVTTTVTSNGSPASGVAVSGTWSNGATGTASCTTNSSGRCTVSKTWIGKSTSSVRFTVGLVGGSTVFGGTASITVAKP